ncbi:conserved hypothetical protein [Ricinus communis]|uniref:Prolamin-like domain-containing protein n=1 Tax=Ricinus communis TaxID=3988 RepID=B9T2J0_RICCO|nr:conserved hypothetical protein [Ricinus communis]
MEGRTILVYVLIVGMIFMASSPGVAEAMVSIIMNPCELSKCIEACKNLLHDKFLSASCYQGTALIWHQYHIDNNKSFPE